ncbi:cholinesterase 1-like [Argonauta hians]
MEPLKYVFIVSVIFHGYSQVIGTTIIDTTSGKIKGSTISVLNTDLNVFLGIPFAKPPVGDLRFRRPEPVDRWEGVKETKQFSASCMQSKSGSYLFDIFPQPELWKSNSNLSEDCLYLNIWAPTKPRNPGSNLTTMVWIHGGAFLLGSSSLKLHNGRWLAASENVIVASFNYRLGVFGFLLLDDERAPGNMGLMDQILAIKWIRDNIASFGGDPNKLTLFGESAGSMSVSLHVVSPLSRNLFNNAIMMSGTYSARWGLNTAEQNRKNAKEMAEAFKCPANNPGKMLDCFLEASTTKLVGQFHKKDTYYLCSFCPFVDNYLIPNNVTELLNDKHLKKDVLAGFVKNEGSLFLPLPVYSPTNSTVSINKSIANTIIKLITRMPHLQDVILDTIYYIYSPSVYSDSKADKYRKILERFISDYWFKCRTIEYAQTFSIHSNVYIYSFEYLSKLAKLPKLLGVSHGSDVRIVFGHALSGRRNYSDKDIAVTKMMTSLFANFSKSGNPNNGDCNHCSSEPWTKFAPNSQKYIVLNDPTRLEMKDDYMNNICGFWSDIFPRRSQHLDPVPTSGAEKSWNFHRRILASFITILLSLTMSFTTLC